MKESLSFFSLLVFFLLSSECLAEEWSYTEKIPSGDICYYTKRVDTGELFLALGNGSPDSVWEECDSNGSRERALSDFKKNGARSSHDEPSEGISRAFDIYKICVAGTTNNTQSFSEVISKYIGKPKDIFIMRKAHQYGLNSARGARDCKDYVMGR